MRPVTAAPSRELACSSAGRPPVSRSRYRPPDSTSGGPINAPLSRPGPLSVRACLPSPRPDLLSAKLSHEDRVGTSPLRLPPSECHRGGVARFLLFRILPHLAGGVSCPDAPGLMSDRGVLVIGLWELLKCAAILAGAKPPPQSFNSIVYLSAQQFARFFVLL
ncbi:hypothetical protein NDU88_000892 [Pleurodeles waltl]|uniref:Uncharacterized protein n=1 Tax=Pleurodeles waltl TaxID=8319 RepID=A0AAV7LW09_PLEWA|nr:hypothetical protein NDU88_000892 [Pleurodeles waltl]